MGRAMANDPRPLSDLVAQGWEVLGFTGSSQGYSSVFENTVLLRRQRQHKILKIRRRAFGRGLAVEEMDI